MENTRCITVSNTSDKDLFTPTGNTQIGLFGSTLSATGTSYPDSAFRGAANGFAQEIRANETNPADHEVEHPTLCRAF
jgi:hypothetical protein